MLSSSIAGCAVLGAGYAAALKYVVPSLLFRPPHARGKKSKQIHSAENNVWAEYVDAQPAQKAVIFLHGNATDITRDAWGHRLHVFLGCDVFVPEYPTYSFMREKHPELTTHDTYRVLEEFLERVVIPRSYEQILIFGQSLGGHFAAALAATYAFEPRLKLCLLSTFHNFSDLTRTLLGVRLPWSGSMYNTEKCLQAMPDDTQVLILHGSNDEVIAVSHAVWLLDSLKKRPRIHTKSVFYYGATHNNMPVDAIMAELQQFFLR